MFVTLPQVKARLRVTATDEDADLQALVDQAEAQVLNWCSVTAPSAAVVAGWTPATVPAVVVAAILVQTGELDRFRGDDADAPPRAPDGEVLSVMVRELLRPYHALAMA
jgi:hypothetical protein